MESSEPDQRDRDAAVMEYTIIDETPDRPQFSDEATALLREITALRWFRYIEQAELEAFRTGDFGTGTVRYTK